MPEMSDKLPKNLLCRLINPDCNLFMICIRTPTNITNRLQKPLGF